MKARRFSEEQVIGVLKEGEAGVAVKEICRKQVFSEPPKRHGSFQSAPLRLTDYTAI